MQSMSLRCSCSRRPVCHGYHASARAGRSGKRSRCSSDATFPTTPTAFSAPRSWTASSASATSGSPSISTSRRTKMACARRTTTTAGPTRPLFGTFTRYCVTVKWCQLLARYQNFVTFINGVSYFSAIIIALHVPLNFLIWIQIFRWNFM